MSDRKLRWKKVASKRGPKLPLFDVRYDQLRHPESDALFTRLVFESADWVNVVARTKDGLLVMVEQYRFGIEDLTLEPVGGLVDEGEEPIEAAKRELLEEAGFGGGEWRSLGHVQANPAIQNNLCHLWFADGVEKVGDQQPDSGEAIRIHLMTLEEVKLATTDGRFLHPLGQATFARVFDIWDQSLSGET